MSDDNGKPELRPRFPFEEDFQRVSEHLQEEPWKEILFPNLTSDECLFGDWLFSSKELVLRNIRKRKIIRLENLTTGQRLLSAMIALSLHPGYQPSQFVSFLDKICRFHFGKSLVDAFCLDEPDPDKNLSLDWASIKKRYNEPKQENGKL